MSIMDWLTLGALGLFFISIVGVGILSRMHFKNKKMQLMADNAQRLMRAYVALYDKLDLGNAQKLNGVVDNVVKSLQEKGFTVSDQDRKNIEAGVEKTVSDLRMKQKATEDKPADVIVNE